ncbi:putative LPS assembly protein LptD [Lacinutrix venerupis]|uniref:Organic solvent tolerance protein OstA n=1 Tax=Lacinutrix venerupis TaxID=1486034 RepID=A0AAC9LMB6_9FLAO|nr:putative LPS assembly protein LptD [Lacinutrix venerupis]APY00228.1 organic solvent tolerance protein OstA [Lacinutrix venerupis]
MAIQKPSHTLAKIHTKALHTNRIHILFALSFTVFINTLSFAQIKDGDVKSIEIPKSEDLETVSPPTKTEDTIVIPKEELTTIIESDSTKTDSTKTKPALLQGTVSYTAQDYNTFNRKEQKMYLYNEAKVNYLDMEITAGTIVIDYSKNLIYAGRVKDTAGEFAQRPVFKQGENIVEPDSIIFNFKNKKAIIFNSNTEQQGMKIRSERSKKENDSVYFLNKMRITTAESEEDPEYYFMIDKAKLVPNKKIVASTAQMFIYDVPTPIIVPFAFFPLSKKQTSGVIFPSFGEQNDRGYFLQNGGYYFAISDYLDLAVLGDYYTNGSYGLRIENNYKKRYKYNGRFGFRYENIINSERGFPDYAKSTIYNLRWSHSQDTKSNPNSRFSASVNLGSSNYYQQSQNQVNTASFLNNTLASSVSYSKTFEGEPQINMSLTATHSQNTQTEEINLTLPTLQASVGRVYPFAPKVGSKKGIIQNINLQYSVRAENRIQTTDSLFFKSEMFDDAKIGMRHSIPVTTNFKLFNYFSLSANANFDETWTLNTINRYYDSENSETVTEDITGFDSYRTYNFGASLGTTIYGQFNFEKEGQDKKIKAIRHVMRPSISYNVNPAFDRYYDSYEVTDINGETLREDEYSRFEGGLYGAPNKTYSSSIGLSLSNNIEAKVRDKDSTQTEPKKITILNNLNFSTSYNLAGDSLRFSPVRMSGGTQLFDNKMNVNFGATLDPYALDNNNNKVDEFNINNGGSLFRLTSANLTLGYSLNSKGNERKSNTSERSRNETLDSGGRDDDLFGRSQDFADQRYLDEDDDKEEEMGDLYNYGIPWSLRLAYAVNYSNSQRQNEISSHSLMFSGDIEISPKWSIGASSGYDFKNQGFSYTQLRFARDLLSWRMNFSWIPFSDRSSWNFFIGIKSSILKDLKYEKRLQPDQQL